jgi:hypothetical protein
MRDNSLQLEAQLRGGSVLARVTVLNGENCVAVCGGENLALKQRPKGGHRFTVPLSERGASDQCW